MHTKFPCVISWCKQDGKGRAYKMQMTCKMLHSIPNQLCSINKISATSCICAQTLTNFPSNYPADFPEMPAKKGRRK